MPEIIVGRRTFPSGTRAQDVQIPGPGLYEAVFDVPAWIPAEDFDITRPAKFPVNGSMIEHIRTHYSDADNAIYVRFRVTDDPASRAPAINTTANSLASPALVVGGLELASILRGVALLLGTWLATRLVEYIVEAVREVRKIAEVSPIAITLGAAAIFIAVAAGAWKSIKPGVT